MDVSMATAFVIAVGVPIIMHRPVLAAVMDRLEARGMQRINYKGKEVVTAGGVLTLMTTISALTVLLLFLLAQGVGVYSLREGTLLAAGMMSMAFWGWQDDCSSEKEIKGFRGHVGTLWREKRMTSGLWKVWGGCSTAMLVSLVLTHSLWTWLLASGLLALSPNVINLFDLRPTRAFKVFWLMIAAGILLGIGTMSIYDVLWMLPVITSTVLLFPFEGGGRIMLGDTGSNALGYAAGFFLVVGLAPHVQAVILTLFVAVQVFAEFSSISRLIQRVRWLDRLDAWGRATEPD